MNILISQRVVRREGRGDMDALESDYVTFFQSFGVKLLPVANTERNIEAYASGLSVEGVILSGGNDVDPKLYGGAVSPQSDFSVERDATDRALLEFAIKEKLPVLGICRGMQFINVFFGGKLLQNIALDTGADHLHPHDVVIVEKSARAFLGIESLRVNSFHRQGMREQILSGKLRPFALGEDGSVEGFFHPMYPIAGIMWHPERSGSNLEMDTKLVDAFVKRELFWKKV